MVDIISIAVLIPTKNRRFLLERALKSVFGQSVLPDEIIVVNDGSNYDTKEYLDSLLIKDNRLKIINRQESGGVNTARNQGTRMAESEWIAWLDDDDEFAPDAIEKMKKRIQSLSISTDVAGFNTIVYREGESLNGGYKFKNGEEFHDLTYDEVMTIKHRVTADYKVAVRKNLSVEKNYWLPESVNGFESYFWNLIARDGIGIRVHKDIATIIHQEVTVGDRLSLSASAKNPWPLFKLHFKQIFQHWKFYIRHPVMLMHKKITMIKLCINSIVKVYSDLLK